MHLVFLANILSYTWKPQQINKILVHDVLSYCHNPQHLQAIPLSWSLHKISEVINSYNFKLKMTSLFQLSFFYYMNRIEIKHLIETLPHDIFIFLQMCGRKNKSILEKVHFK